MVLLGYKSLTLFFQLYPLLFVTTFSVIPIVSQL